MAAFGTHKTNVVDVAWDAGAQEKKVRSGEKRAYYAKIYAWYDPDLDEANKSTYKFIHHEVSADGNPGDAVVKACTSGIGVLNGGMGGTNIPKADRQGVYDHLAKHLRDADREPPPLNGELVESEPTHFLNHQELLRLASGEVWAILPSALQSLLANAALGLPNGQPDGQSHGIAPTMALSRPGPKSGRVARVSIVGPISRRASFWSMLFGGTSVEGITKTLRDVAADETIGTVLLDIDSPGGTMSGIPELADEVRRLRESKRVVALANSLMASAAYWIGSQADEIVATPEALVGSIGVYTVHEDWSKALEQMGVKISYIFAGKYKTEGNFDEPLTDEARSSMQGIVDDGYRLFTMDVARGRDVSPATVRTDYGEGRVLTASIAKSLGMIDRVASADETIRRLTGLKAESEAGQSRGTAPTALDPRVDGDEEGGQSRGTAPTALTPCIDGDDEIGNSQARLALMRRRLELAEKS